MAAFDHHEHGVFPRDMLNTIIHQQTKARRASFASCHPQDSKGLVMRALFGRTTE
jgi:hypothetical protein